MENVYQYFKRDISWLSFNYRVLMEAENESLPVYERIKFLSIYSSNLEEFYEIRVAEHRGVIMKKNYTEESTEEAEETLAAITREVNWQQQEYKRVFREVVAELKRQHIHCISTVSRNLFMKRLSKTSLMKKSFHSWPR